MKHRRRRQQSHPAHLVLDTRVLSLGVLTDEDGVDVVIRRLETLDGHARADVGEEGEGSSEGEVERDVALANCAGSVWVLPERAGGADQKQLGEMDW
jgi:hypothetical protein